MNKRIIASFTLFAFVSLGTPLLAAPGTDETNSSSVVLERTWGEVDAREGALEVGNSLDFGQTVKTGSESGATLAFPDGSRIRVSPNSEFRISNGSGQPNLYLLSGKILASASSKLQIQTFRTGAVASEGEFVMTTSSVGTDLRVLSGNARMVSSKDSVGTTSFQRLGSLPDGIADSALLAFDELKSHQVMGEDVTFGAQEEIIEEQAVARADSTPPSGPQLEKGLRPDQDLTEDDLAGLVFTDGGASTAGASGATGSTAGSTGASSAGAGTGVAAGGSAWPYAIGGIIGLGAVIAIASDNEDEDPLDQGGNNFNVPSPSLP